MSERGDPREAERVGLCVRCAHGVRQPSAKGSVFWRCRRARSDPRFLPYPPLPVRACPGFEPGTERGRSEGPSSA